MKYDTQIGELKTKLDASNSVLVILPKEVNVDKLAAALSLYLSLKQAGKSVSILSESELKVSQAALFGIGDIKSSLPENNSGNFVIKLDGVVEGGKVPALVNLDWFPSGNDLNLVFHVAPGKKFEPINISHHYDTTAFQLIFFVGAPTLGDFGSLYTNNVDKLGDATKVSIDNSQNNTLFGSINITDPDTASLSEIVSQVIQGLSLPQDGDIATNIVTGIYDATQNLTVNVSGDTFIAVGQEMQMGAKVPFIQAQLNQGGFDIRKFGRSDNPQVSQPSVSAESVNEQSLASSGEEGQPSQQTSEPAATEAPVTDTPTPANTTDAPDTEQAKSQYEVPTGEQVSSGNPENTNPAPDWLTPKIFKGGSLG